jgi:Restriction endonuclease
MIFLKRISTQLNRIVYNELRRKSMIRKENEFINIDEILRPEYFELEVKDMLKRYMINGDMIKLGKSLRLRTFYHKGTTCVKCGLEAKFFVKEKAVPDEKYHINLYGINEEGKEVLFTHDHIMPRSKGGKDHLSNTQTMCVHCNMAKGDKIEY